MPSRPVHSAALPAFLLSPLLLLGPAAVPAAAGEIVVTVAGLTSTEGEIGCALHGSPDGFPMEGADARLWAPAAAGAPCVFSDLAAGDYAVAVSQDFDGDRETDTNFIGIPTEPWGVSNGVRPSLRAPRFEEATVTLEEDQRLEITVEIAQ